jgi:hypothetical protein
MGSGVTCASAARFVVLVFLSYLRSGYSQKANRRVTRGMIT